MLHIYTDGSAISNPGGPGGWSVIVVDNGKVIKTISARDESKSVTNNRMELLGATKALQYIDTNNITCNVKVFTDSMYVKNGITQWINNWKRNGFISSKGTPVVNKDLWEPLDKLYSKYRKQVKWEWVKAHHENEYNILADQLAYATAKDDDTNPYRVEEPLSKQEKVQSLSGFEEFVITVLLERMNNPRRFNKTRKDEDGKVTKSGADLLHKWTKELTGENSEGIVLDAIKQFEK